jgi:hypothetical protein|tara:strand:- start:362 stop:1261 length:900 start_codon:yes stop_codon:yes gene_type:complete
MEAAEKLKLTAENLNSMLSTSLRKISDTRKRTKKLKAVSILRRRRKKQEKKLEIPSEFKKSTNRINKILPRGLGKNMMTSVVELISLLLVGVAINNIDELKEKLEKLREGLDKNVKFIKGIVDNVSKGTRGFIALFESEDREKQFKEIEKETNEYKKIEKDKLEIEKLMENLRKEYDIVQQRFKKADTAGINFNEKDVTFNKTGTLSTGATFEIDEEGENIAVTKDGKEETFNLSKFIKNNKTEIPNIVTVNNELISNNGDKFKINTKDLISDLNLRDEFNEEESAAVTYVFTEIKTGD